MGEDWTTDPARPVRHTHISENVRPNRLGRIGDHRDTQPPARKHRIPIPSQNRGILIGCLDLGQIRPARPQGDIRSGPAEFGIGTSGLGVAKGRDVHPPPQVTDPGRKAQANESQRRLPCWCDTSRQGRRYLRWSVCMFVPRYTGPGGLRPFGSRLPAGREDDTMGCQVSIVGLQQRNASGRGSKMERLGRGNPRSCNPISMVAMLSLPKECYDQCLASIHTLHIPNLSCSTSW
ncbi:hypothetical protein VTK26DRAFT_4463 [Humicola hyalothermophila]